MFSKLFLIINFVLIVLLNSRFLTMKTTSTNRVVVIGAGAAGYFSAIECARVLKEKSKNSYEVCLNITILLLFKIIFSIIDNNFRSDKCAIIKG